MMFMLRLKVYAFETSNIFCWNIYIEMGMVSNGCILLLVYNNKRKWKLAKLYPQIQIYQKKNLFLRLLPLWQISEFYKNKYLDMVICVCNGYLKKLNQQEVWVAVLFCFVINFSLRILCGDIMARQCTNIDLLK